MSKREKIKMLEEKLEYFKEYKIEIYNKKFTIVKLYGGIIVDTPQLCKGLCDYNEESIDLIIEKLGV